MKLYAAHTHPETEREREGGARKGSRINIFTPEVDEFQTKCICFGCVLVCIVMQKSWHFRLHKTTDSHRIPNRCVFLFSYAGKKSAQNSYTKYKLNWWCVKNVYENAHEAMMRETTGTWKCNDAHARTHAIECATNALLLLLIIKNVTSESVSTSALWPPLDVSAFNFVHTLLSIRNFVFIAAMRCVCVCHECDKRI